MSSGIQKVQPAVNAAAVTPSDTVNFARVANSIYVGGTGDVVVVFSGGGTITFVGVPAGMILPVQAKRINSTSTTATSMVALYT